MSFVVELVSDLLAAAAQVRGVGDMGNHRKEIQYTLRRISADSIRKRGLTDIFAVENLLTIVAYALRFVKLIVFGGLIES
jgi:hypothetical protein